MRSFKSYFVGALAFIALAVAPYAAAHASILWSPQQGDLYFNGLSPSQPGGLTTPIVALPLQVDAGTRTVTATGTGPATATLNKASGVITSASLTTAAAAEYVLTLTDSAIGANDIVLASVGLGSATTGEPAIEDITVTAGTVVITVRNVHASAALNGTIKIRYTSQK